LGNRIIIHEKIEGIVKEKQEAIENYEKDVQEGKSTVVILTQEEDNTLNLFFTIVKLFGDDTQIRIQISYVTELLNEIVYQKNRNYEYEEEIWLKFLIPISEMGK
jgi:hypothetical protein